MKMGEQSIDAASGSVKETPFKFKYFAQTYY
jgi:hypothetical protein